MTPEVGRRRPGPAGITASPLRDGYTAAMSGRPPADPDSLPTEATVIGFAGPSGSGKTHLAQALAKCLAPSPCLLLSADSYYRDLAHLPLPERASADFDDPGAIEHERLAADLDSLREGRAVEIPVYDFASHKRSGSRHVEPARWILVDGLLLLHWEDVRTRLDLGVYVDATAELCLERRLARDVVRRGRSEGSVLEQWERTVLPARGRWIEPSRAHAHLVVDGGDEESATRAVLSRLARPPVPPPPRRSASG